MMISGACYASISGTETPIVTRTKATAPSPEQSLVIANAQKLHRDRGCAGDLSASPTGPSIGDLAWSCALCTPAAISSNEFRQLMKGLRNAAKNGATAHEQEHPPEPAINQSDSSSDSDTRSDSQSKQPAATRPARPNEPWWHHIPQDLTIVPQWVDWTYHLTNKGKWTKVPRQPDGTSASSTDPSTWASFEDAQTAYLTSGDTFDGIGFVVTENDPFVGFDFDHVFDRHGALDATVKRYLERLNTYAEVSPSGHGIRVFVRGKLPPEGRKFGDIECYESGRYLTLTGDKLPDAPAGYPRLSGGDRERTRGNLCRARCQTHIEAEAVTAPISASDEEQLERARRSRNGAAFISLYDAGDWQSQGFSSQSEADLTLCSMLRFWLGADATRIDAVFRRSRLYRNKWDLGDYAARTIDKALPGDVYSPRVHADRENVDRKQGAQDRDGAELKAEPQTEAPEFVAPISLDVPILPQLPSGIFPPWSEAFIDAVAASTETPRELAAMMELGVFATTVQRKFKVLIKPGWSEPLNLYTMTLLPSGLRKTPVLDAVTRPLHRWEAEELEKVLPDITRKKSSRATELRRINICAGRQRKSTTRRNAKSCRMTSRPWSWR